VPASAAGNADAVKEIYDAAERNCLLETMNWPIDKKFAHKEWADTWESLEQKFITVLESDDQHASYVELIKKYPFVDLTAVPKVQYDYDAKGRHVSSFDSTQTFVSSDEI